MVRALLVDDHAVVRTGIRALLEASGRAEVVGEASSGEEGVRKARSLKPDIVVMDLAMPGMDGVEATRRIAALGIETKILVLTVHDEDEYLVPALHAGADGFLNKSAADTDLLGAIEAVVRGHSYLPRRASAIIARQEAQRHVASRESAPSRATSPAPSRSWASRTGATSCASPSKPGCCGLRRRSSGTPKARCASTPQIGRQRQ